MAMREYIWSSTLRNNMDEQVYYSVIMGIYVMIVLYSTKLPYRMMVERGVEDIRAVYYNRKIVHVFAGGLDRFVFRISSLTSGTLWFVE